MGEINFLELIAGTSISMEGMKRGLQEGEELAERFAHMFSQKIAFEPSKAMDDLSKLTRGKLEEMNQAMTAQAATVKQAYAVGLASSAQLKTALQEEQRVVEELIKRWEAHLAVTKAGSIAHQETIAKIQQLKASSEALGESLQKLGLTAKLVFGGILAIVTAFAGAVVASVHKTIEWGEQLEVLGGRLGMSAQEAGVFIGVMERFGVNTTVAVRSMQMLENQMRMTQNSMDPFATKMGHLLGSLRDTNGVALTTSQVFDLVRQKVLGATSETERLQLAQVFGAQKVLTVLKLTNEEYEKQRKSIEEIQGPVELAAGQSLAYKEAIGELNQQFRGMAITLGTKVLPILTDIIHAVSDTVGWFEKLKVESPQLRDALIGAISPIVPLFHMLSTAAEGFTQDLLRDLETTGIVAQGTADNFKNMNKWREEGAKQSQKEKEAADAKEKADAAALGDLELLINGKAQMVALGKEDLELTEKAAKMGMGGDPEVQLMLDKKLKALREQHDELTKNLGNPLLANQQEKLQVALHKNEMEQAEALAHEVERRFQNEELHLKSIGALNISNEIALMEKKLSSAQIEGDEREKIEGEIYEKRKQYAESAMKFERELGFASIDDEIAYRKSRAAEMLGKGDVFGAGDEVVKAKQLAISQAESSMELMKKIRIVSFQSEIDFQKKKLELARGNAEEEKKILSSVADLDKQLYDARLEFSLNYTSKTLAAYEALMKATHQTTSEAHPKGEENTFEQAARDAERQNFQRARDMRNIGEHGGTDEQRDLVVKQSQEAMKMAEDALKTGQKLSEGQQAVVDSAKVVLERASGQKIREPGDRAGGIGSLAGQIGIETSEVPRLDTSFIDLATRIRDVILGAVPNIQNLGEAAAAAVKTIAGSTGFVPRSANLGPGAGVSDQSTQGTVLATGAGSPAPAPQPFNPNLTPTGTFVPSQSGEQSLKIDELITTLKAHTEALSTGDKDNNQSLIDALNQVLSNRQDRIHVTVDPNSGDVMADVLAKQLA